MIPQPKIGDTVAFVHSDGSTHLAEVTAVDGMAISIAFERDGERFTAPLVRHAEMTDEIAVAHSWHWPEVA